MNPFEMVVIIVLICTAGSIIGRMVHARSAEGVDMGGACGKRRGPWRHHRAWGAPRGEQTVDIKPYVAKIEALEERIRVLERIVTDKTERLKRELNELED